jgi:BASS family bile acid:Na+ symporter
VLRFMALLTNLFPLWVLAGGAVGLFQPQALKWLKGEYITAALASTMLFMGMTLELDDFKRVLKNPKQVFLGFACQFTLMPLLGWTMAKVFALPVPLAVGLILVSACPGGTASNLVTLIAQADVALSVLMTTVSTCAAPVMTPLLTSLLAGSLVPVDASGLLLSTLQVVLAPVAIGLLINTKLPGAQRSNRMRPSELLPP